MKSICLPEHWVCFTFTCSPKGSFLIPKSAAQKVLLLLFLPFLSLTLLFPLSFSQFFLLFCLWFYLPSWHFSACLWFMFTSPDLKLFHPSIRHSAAPRRTGRSWTDCTRGLGGGITLSVFDDLTVRFIDKMVLCVEFCLCWSLQLQLLV